MAPPLNIYENIFDLSSKRDSISEIRTCMPEFRVDGAETTSENVGEEEDEVDGVETSSENAGEEEEDYEDMGVDGAETTSEVVGEEGDDEDKYMEELKGDICSTFWEELSTVLITGMAGIGKTTLARQVYNHPHVVAQFKGRAWVCVTGLTGKEVLMKLIRQVVYSKKLGGDSLLEKMDRRDKKSLQEMLHQHLKGKRYLIVLDDVHKEMIWESIWEGLPHEKKSSKLLLTSRSKNTRRDPFSSDEMESRIHYAYRMQPLNPEESWRFFSKTIFCGIDKSHQFPKHLLKMGRDMLTLCGGVRLAIKEMGMQLAEKRRSGIEWEQLLQPTRCNAILEAIMLMIIQRLDSRSDWVYLEEVINVLKMMVDFVRDKELEEGSRLYYFICDVVDMAHYLGENRPISKNNAESILRWTSEVKMSMLEGAEAESSSYKSESFGEGDQNGNVVGLEEDVDLLLRRVISNGELHSYLITGMTGIGKTALVSKVYNHAGVVDQFDRRVWVCCFTNFSHKKILMKIIEQLVDCEEFKRDSLLEKMERADNFCVGEMLRKHLEGMRYLIVLDDFPKEMCLGYILEFLPFEVKGSRLLLTSRFAYKDVNIGYTHWVKTLDPRKSWKLLLKTIPSELKFPKNLEKMGRDMLRKCDGLPLAIIEVGKQLAKRRPLTEREWEEALESIDLGVILPLFESSYQKLDPESKPCFLHMAFFKEYTCIRTGKMEHVSAIVSKVSENQIRSYVSILTQECFVEIKDKKSCRVNAILHMLSIKKAEEEIGLEILRSNGSNRPFESPRHHRVIICSRDKFNCSTDQDKHLVSLFFHGGGFFDTSPSYWKSFELLKILDWEDFGLKNLPESGTDTMMGLRYLGLRNNYIQKLPLALGSLKELEVLDIALNFMVEVPDIIWEMCSLRHLYMSDVICREPLKIDTLANLESLTYISFDNWTYELSCKGKMTRLNKLGIEEIDENSNVSKLFASLVELKNLETLILRGFRFRSMPCLDNLGILRSIRTLKLEGNLPMLPSASNFPRLLESLTLVNSCLDEDPMPILAARLPVLRHLKLRNAYTGEEMVISKYMNHLEVLCMEELWNVRDLQVGKGRLSNLKNLEIKNCPYLETLPEAIGEMRKLEELKMVTTKTIATKIRNSHLISEIRQRSSDFRLHLNSDN
ncbi:disease resistance protein RPP13-like isoform X2 [Salvia miltiorrhiza]|nr:disease resistance protein RPP13-like isoform X2 [Salvia miltiorrhiza]